MKKLVTSAFALWALLSCIETKAQTIVTIPAANTASTGANTTIHRKPLGSRDSYERTALKYTQAEIGMYGNITAIGFYCDTINAPGITPIKVYIKEVADSTFTPSTVAAEETGATLVFNDTLKTPAFVKNNWVTITLTTPFLHAVASNIEIIIETNSAGTAGSDLVNLAKGFRYTTLLNNKMEYWQANGNMPTTNGTTNTMDRPNVQLTFTTGAACTAPPTAGTTTANITSVCSGSTVDLSLLGNSVGVGQTYQWVSSPDGTTWTNIAGATFTMYTATVTANTYYSCVLTCSSQSVTATPVQVTLNPFYQCYCTNGIGGGCTAATVIDSVAITGSTLANGPLVCPANNYIAYPSSGTATAALTQGLTYTLTTKFGGNVIASVWIDYNQNGTFETTEWQQICTTSTAGTNVLNNITVPFTSLLGQTGMRIRSRANGAQNDSSTSCAAFGSGETQDYIVTIVAGAPCTAPPTTGTTVASATTICSGGVVNLSLNGNSIGSGQTFQWQSSPDGTTWTAISGATMPAYTATITANTYYSCVLTCSSQSATSTPVLVSLNPFYQCYCTNGIGGGCTATSVIDSVAISSTTLVNGPLTCPANNYTVYPATGSTTASLTQGNVYKLNTKFGGNVIASVWIDYNQNGSYDNTEWKQITTAATAGADMVTTLIIPYTATAGKTGMRIRTRANGALNDSTSACTTFGSGETQDYVVTIVAAGPCTAPPDPGTTVASATTVCSGSTVNLSLNGNTTGIGQTYQWQSSTNGITWTTIAGATLQIYTATVTATTYYSCVLTCGTQSSTSPAVDVTISPFYMCYCTAGLGGGCVTSAIDSVAIAGTFLKIGPTGCSPNNYAFYPLTPTNTASLSVGNNYVVDTRYTGNVVSSLWIDYNQNGVFDNTEWVRLCSTSVALANVVKTIAIPSNAMLGTTGMRIRTTRATGGGGPVVNDSLNACTTFNSGETEDYLVTLVPHIAGIESQTAASDVYVYPNPSNGIVNIAMNIVNPSKMNYEIVNANGQTVVNEQVSFASGQLTKTFDLSAYAKGVYFIRVVTDKEIIIKKVIMQ